MYLRAARVPPKFRPRRPAIAFGAVFGRRRQPPDEWMIPRPLGVVAEVLDRLWPEYGQLRDIGMTPEAALICAFSMLIPESDQDEVQSFFAGELDGRYRLTADRGGVWAWNGILNTAEDTYEQRRAAGPSE